MSGLMSRNKGKRAERQVIELIQPIVDQCYEQAGRRPPVMQRNTLQSDQGGFDITGLEWLSLEVKHHENLQVEQWWRQTITQAAQNPTGRELVPVLFYKRNNISFRVRMYHGLSAGSGETHLAVVDVSVEDFSWWLYHELNHRLNLTSKESYQ
jgi:hypothetical protein